MSFSYIVAHTRCLLEWSISVEIINYYIGKQFGSYYSSTCSILQPADV